MLLEAILLIYIFIKQFLLGFNILTACLLLYDLTYLHLSSFSGSYLLWISLFVAVFPTDQQVDVLNHSDSFSDCLVLPSR